MFEFFSFGMQAVGFINSTKLICSVNQTQTGESHSLKWMLLLATSEQLSSYTLPSLCRFLKLLSRCGGDETLSL